MEQVRRHNNRNNSRFVLLIEILYKDQAVWGCEYVFVLLPIKLFKELVALIILHDPVSSDRTDLGSIRQGIFTRMRSFFHHITEKVIVHIRAAVGLCNKDVRSSSFLSRKVKRNSLLTKHLVSLIWAYLEVLLEILIVNELIHNVCKVMD